MTPTPTLFWILPMPEDKEGWMILTFPKKDYPLNQDHISLWKDVIAKIILAVFGREAGLSEIQPLYNAYPRGRLEQGKEDDTWWIGFGKDYPEGWDEARLLEKLGVTAQNCTFDYDQHWKANPNARMEADLILRRTK